MTITEIVNQNPKPKHVRLVTHKCNFHSDDVFATALLWLYLVYKGIDPVLIRTFTPKEDGYTDDTPNTIVYDIGLGQYDHHQVGDDAKHCIRIDKCVNREGEEYTVERKYAAVGLIWKEIGSDIVGKYADAVYDGIIRYIDDHDNGNGHNPLSTLIGNMNPLNTALDEDYDHQFNNAVSIAMDLLNFTIDKYINMINNEERIRKFIEGEAYLLTPEFIPGADDVCRELKIPFYVYPNVRGGYCFKTICPDPKDMSKHFIDIPDDVRTWPGVTFLHPSRFLGSAETKERACEICETLFRWHVFDNGNKL